MGTSRLSNRKTRSRTAVRLLINHIGAVVVIVRIGLGCELVSSCERQGEELLTERLVTMTPSYQALVGDSLVDDILRVNLHAIAAGRCVDVVPEERLELLGHMDPLPE